MKVLTSLLLLMIAWTVNAEIYKCIATNGKIVYQDMECPKTTQAKKIAIEKFDPAKIIAAQKKLSENLKEFAIYQDLKARRDFKEREIQAMERNAAANENIAAATRYQAQTRLRNYRYADSYFHFPWFGQHHHDRDKHKPDRPEKQPGTDNTSSQASVSFQQRLMK